MTEKTNDELLSSLCDAMRPMLNEAREEGIKEGIQKGIVTAGDMVMHASMKGIREGTATKEGEQFRKYDPAARLIEETWPNLFVPHERIR